MVLAMAKQQLKQSSEARAALTEGLKLADHAVARTDGVQWNDQMSAHIFMRQAREMIERDGSDASTK